jgi:hypothetical protein
MTTKEDPETKRAKAEARQLLSLLKDYLQLEAVDKLTVAISLGIALVVLFVLLFAGVFCLAMSLSVLLSRLLHSFAGGYALTGLLLIALGVVFWMARKSLLENFVMRAVAKVVTNVVKRAKKELTDDNNPTTIANK